MLVLIAFLLKINVSILLYLTGVNRKEKQENTFLTFMEQHRDLAKNFIEGDRVGVESLWSELSKQLNKDGPPQKDVNGWKKLWSDWKGNIRKKLAHNKNEDRATGGGPFKKFILSDTEETIEQLCGLYTAIEGIASSQSYGAGEAVVDDIVDVEVAELDTTNTNIESPLPRKRVRENTMNECIKKNMASEVGAMEIKAQTTKEILENSTKHVLMISEFNSGLRRVYKAIEKTSDLVSKQNALIAEQNKDPRKHYLVRQEHLFEKNRIQQKLVEIQQKKIHRNEKYKFMLNYVQCSTK
ncbi:PREDICTED: uncharacterized protein LOC108361780 [Rhagoletis zephyria]|uniref:uncharacterized protein LOC108361780 n=1 Tax=Rhagoletis zephyria TaxID=28612 RepID=UPI00081141C2|nr:PREDICTED: uncharacterized protein LOC108361780 [Rhagoletis zephyria]